MTTAETLAVLTGVSGSIAAIAALWLTRQANRKAENANQIAQAANRISEHALTLQEDESRVRLVVEPRMMSLMGEEEDGRPRPVVKVINLSKFPITIVGIHWKSKTSDGAGFYWKNPTIANPYRQLPARLEPRAALTAIGRPDSFKSVEDLLSVQGCLVFTDCGEKAEGMTDQWNEHCAALAAAANKTAADAK